MIWLDPMAGPGRNRSEQSRCAILETALHLARTKGYANLTMNGIAAEAKVGKQTIYRWWSSKAAVVLEALREFARMEIEAPDSGALFTDLDEFLSNTFLSDKRRTGIDSVLRAMMAEAQHDPAFAELFRREFIDSRRAYLQTIFERARARDEIPSTRDSRLWIDIAFGVMWYRLLAEVGPINRRLSRKLALLLTEAAGASVPPNRS